MLLYFKFMYGLCIGSNVTPIQRKGNCLFLVISCCKHTTKNRHSEIRISTDNKIINEWEDYKEFIVDLLMVNSTKDNKNLLFRNIEYGGSVSKKRN